MKGSFPNKQTIPSGFKSRLYPFQSSVRSIFLSAFIASDKSLPSGITVISSAPKPRFFGKSAEYHSLFDSNVFVELFLGCIREIVYNLSLQNSEAVTLPQNSTLIKNALDYINKNLFTIRNISEISDAIFVSKNYFLAFFKQNMNISPKKYIIEKRLVYAHDMLLSGQRPMEIYEKVGFETYSSFYRAYIAKFGKNPSAAER